MPQLWLALAVFGWGVAGVFDKKAVENGNSRATFLSFHLFNVPLACLLLVVIPLVCGPVNLNASLVLWEGIDALCAMVALIVYYHALTKTQASWVLGITAGYPIIGQMLAFLALGEDFSWMSLAAAATVSLGVAAIGYSASKEHKALSRRDRVILWLCVAFCTLLWGVLGVLDKQGTRCGQPMEGFLVVCMWKALFACVAIPLLARGQTAVDMTNRRMWTYSSLASACVAGGNIGFLLALPLLPTGYVIVVTACYPLIMYILALCFLGEKLNWSRVLGIALIVAGLALAELGRPGSLTL
jgi:drug/metabolite transporter (DMT)-like permease